MSTLDAIVLVGGRGTRLGGVDKATLVVDGQTLLAGLLDALRSEAEFETTGGQVAVVGPADSPRWVRSTTEDPPGSGPVAAIDAGLTSLALRRSRAVWTLVLAVDQPRAQAVVPLLCRAIAGAESNGSDAGVAAIVPADADGRWQWLLAAYRTAELVRAIASLDDIVGAPMHRVFGQLTVQVADVPHHLLGDIDTLADLARWQGTISSKDDVQWS